MDLPQQKHHTVLDLQVLQIQPASIKASHCFGSSSSTNSATVKMFKIVASLFALILIVNLVESQSGYDCYWIYRESDGTCHHGFNNKPTAEECCEIGAEAVGKNGVNWHCEPCWNV